MNTSSCRSCGAAIIWAISPTGKRIPLDAEPVSHAYELLADGSARVVDARVSHFRSCPDADHWSRRKPTPTTPTAA